MARERSVLATILLSTFAIGCETISEDFGALAESLTPTSPGEAAVMAVDQTDADERREGLLLLSNAPFGGVDAYLELYREYAANDPDPIVRAVAVRALGRHGAPEDAPLVATNLDHEEVQVRWEAAKALQRLHDPSVVPKMLALLRDDEQVRSDIRAELARALGQYPQDQVFHALIAALDQRELAVNDAARHSLATMTGQELGLDAADWLRWYNQVTTAGQDPFAGAAPYLYPTYTRDPTFFERIAFWNVVRFEQPGTPAGLTPAGERRTYGEN